MALCSTHMCEGKVVARGLCERCYRTAKRSGAPLPPIRHDAHRETGGVIVEGLIARVPLWGRRNTIRAWAIVDAADADLVAPYRWFLMNNGYAVRNTPDRHKLAMHRHLLGLDYGDALEGDHESRNRLDNRRSNLRYATVAQQAQNMPRVRRGVRLPRRGRSWEARVKVSGHEIRVGGFASVEEAEQAAVELRRLHLPFANN